MALSVSRGQFTYDQLPLALPRKHCGSESWHACFALLEELLDFSSVIVSQCLRCFICFLQARLDFLPRLFPYALPGGLRILRRCSRFLTPPYDGEEHQPNQHASSAPEITQLQRYLGHATGFSMARLMLCEVCRRFLHGGISTLSDRWQSRPGGRGEAAGRTSYGLGEGAYAVQ